jgi:hypothetical protein
VFSLALAGDRVAWAAGAGGNQVTNLLFLVVLNKPQTIRIPVLTAYCVGVATPIKSAWATSTATAVSSPSARA